MKKYRLDVTGLDPRITIKVNDDCSIEIIDAVDGWDRQLETVRADCKGRLHSEWDIDIEEISNEL